MPGVLTQSMRAPVGECTVMWAIFSRVSSSVVFDLDSLSAIFAMLYDILFVW